MALLIYTKAHDPQEWAGELKSLLPDLDIRLHPHTGNPNEIEAALVAKSALAAGTFAEDFARQDSGQAGDWQWRIQIAPEQIPLLEENGRPAPGGPLRAARVSVEVSKNGVPAATWTTWKPYRAAP